METGQTDFVLTRSRAATSTGANVLDEQPRRLQPQRLPPHPRGRREPTTIGIPHIPQA
jgi:hypothetical protein